MTILIREEEEEDDADYDEEVVVEEGGSDVEGKGNTDKEDENGVIAPPRNGRRKHRANPPKDRYDVEV